MTHVWVPGSDCMKYGRVSYTRLDLHSSIHTKRDGSLNRVPCLCPTKPTWDLPGVGCVPFRHCTWTLDLHFCALFPDRSDPRSTQSRGSSLTWTTMTSLFSGPTSVLLIQDHNITCPRVGPLISIIIT